MRCVAITRIGDPISAFVASELASNPEIEKIVGFGEQPPPGVIPKLKFVRRTVCAPLAELFLEHWVEGVIHPMWAPGAEPSSVVPEVEQVLEACHRAGVEHAVVGSSAMVYGPSWDRPAPRPETSPVEGGRCGVPLVKALVEAEERLAAFGSEHPELSVAVARPCRVLGGGLGDDLSELLSRKVSPLPGPMAPVQVIHTADYARSLAVLHQMRSKGVFNVAPNTVLGPDEIAELAAGRPVFLSSSALERALLTGQRWGLPTGQWSAGRLRFLSDPWLVSTKKLVAETGLKFKNRPQDALAEAVNAQRTPQRRRGFLPRLLGR